MHQRGDSPEALTCAATWVSIGVATSAVGEDGVDGGASLLARADVRLRSAKARGRDRKYREG